MAQLGSHLWWDDHVGEKSRQNLNLTDLNEQM
jgi:hypothetical protein